MKRATAFTLVELLVVVSIIVVLLAMIAPAMDRAVYQAELAACGANLSAVAKGATAYGPENKRLYPYRPSLADGERPIYIGRSGGWTSDTARNTNLDDRYVFRSHISTKALVCPLDGKVDLSVQASRPKTWVYSNYEIYFGWRFKDEKAMARLGDRFEYAGQGYSVLAVDHESFFRDVDVDLFGSTHPDSLGVFWQNVVQDQDNPPPYNLTHGGTYSFWGIVSRARGTVDRNFAFTDLSVTRYDRVVWTFQGASEINDPRMMRIAAYTSKTKEVERQLQLPR
jgi:competence protein ComGC